MEKITLSLILSLFMLLSGFAQGNLLRTYDYDAAGNRILRSTIELRSTVANFDTTAESVCNPSTNPHYEEFVGKNVVKVFPNPTGGLVTLQFKEPIDNGCYQLFNLSGQLLSEGWITSTTTLDLSYYQTGVYMLTIVLNDEKETWKIIKK